MTYDLTRRHRTRRDRVRAQALPRRPDPQRRATTSSTCCTARTARDLECTITIVALDEDLPEGQARREAGRVLPAQHSRARAAVLRVPIKPGRHSGFLFPQFEFGFSNHGGQFLRNAGYYWAPNDYMDLTLAADYHQAQPSYVMRARATIKAHVRVRRAASKALRAQQGESPRRRLRVRRVAHAGRLSRAPHRARQLRLEPRLQRRRHVRRDARAAAGTASSRPRSRSRTRPTGRASAPCSTGAGTSTRTRASRTTASAARCRCSSRVWSRRSRTSRRTRRRLSLGFPTRTIGSWGCSGHEGRDRVREHVPEREHALPVAEHAAGVRGPLRLPRQRRRWTGFDHGDRPARDHAPRHVRELPACRIRAGCSGGST